MIIDFLEQTREIGGGEGACRAPHCVCVIVNERERERERERTRVKEREQ